MCVYARIRTAIEFRVKDARINVQNQNVSLPHSCIYLLLLSTKAIVLSFQTLIKFFRHSSFLLKTHEKCPLELMI